MREPIHNTEIFTPVGSDYVAEDHGHGPPLDPSEGWAKWFLVAVALLLAAATFSAALVANARSSAPAPELWKQDPPALFTKAPDGYGLRELLF